MRLGIDWVSTVIFLLAWAFSQVRTVSIRVRYGVLAGAYAAICGVRLQQQLIGFNLAVAAFAGALAVYYLVRAMRVNGSR